jgi:ferredoxin
MPSLIEAGELATLFSILSRRGYTVAGPAVRDGAIVYDLLDSPDALPVGWSDEQEAGRYRLKRRGDGAWFGYAVGPHSWKKYLHPPEARLFTAQREGSAFRILEGREPAPRLALLGVRACELAAIAVQDKVLLGGACRDPIYEERRAGIFVIAVNCTECAATCFCASMGTGPGVRGRFDLALTELTGPGGHRFLVEAGSDAGREVAAGLERREATAEEIEAAEAAVARAASSQIRRLETEGIRDLLYANMEHPLWDAVAQRCLACANCTMVCPTCFCTTAEDTTDVAGTHAERRRQWDSCFSQNFSYIHGGSVRTSTRARYRQWLTHKLAFWIDQFGESGCVGCGRCIAWCPAGIDLTEEAGAMAQADARKERPDGKPGTPAG